MKNILRIFLVIVFMLNIQAYGASLKKTIKKMNLDENSIVSVSVRRLDSGKEIYAKDEKKYLHPASSLKVVTFAPALATLGGDYEFATKIYKYNNNYYVKLGADPLLTSADLRKLVSDFKNNKVVGKINKIYIDDTIIDKVAYPEGWGSDDIYPYSPMVSPYIVNGNKVKVQFVIRKGEKTPSILQNDFVKFAFINNLEVGSSEPFKIQKIDEDSPIFLLSGGISGDKEITIPVDNPKFYFIANLNSALEKEKIDYNDQFYFAKTPSGALEVASVGHSIESVAKRILQNSDNYSAEVLFKVAGGKYTQSPKPATTADGIKMFYDFYEKTGFDMSDIKIVDGSGLSRYNLATTSWLSDALIYIDKFAPLRNYMATPDVGTLSKRLRHLRGVLWAKTGTLNGVSSLTGYIQTYKEKDLVFSVIIMNFNKKPSVIKGFEDEIIDKLRDM
ncbi:D-alanyl-D-alanine carboxypeptidase/D-alanyl-D-alanine-endopeptidase [bacterium]|nr:D-alanyl-D-alanine carboxypeptidase/D-alanyl-D-alanine-endopeptidase [bacterium]